MPGVSKRILLVEDSPTQAARLERDLSSNEFQVLTIGSAELALTQMERSLPDLIVLDNNLPGMTGNEFCREIRLNANTRSIPVLMLTGENSDAAQMQALASGADDYVVKSVDPDILRARVHALLRKTSTPPAVADVEKRFSRAKLLAIDDSPTFLYLIQKEIGSEQYDVETTASPEDGLRRLSEESFDCVLIDFEMPGLNGAEVCRRIRNMHGNLDPEIVLIVFSSHDDKRRMAAGFEAGADDYISKSSDFAVTKSRIRALLRRKFLVEENRRIADEIQQKELSALHERTERLAAEVRAEMADKLATANRNLAATNEKLDRANQELEQFAYSAAHDLREPLREISLFSEMLKRHSADRLDELGQEYLSHCIDGAKKMSRLIDDLLSYASSTFSEAHPTVCTETNGVIRKVLMNLDTSISQTSAVVTCEPLPDVRLEEIRVEQLFQNLVSNALKYRHPERSPQVRIGSENRHGEWVFSVTDNGVGIAAEYLERVFEPFKRFHSGSKTGTGFGLSICRRIVESCGGRIWAESEPGNGSVFRFTLPERIVSSRGQAGTNGD